MCIHGPLADEHTGCMLLMCNKTSLLVAAVGLQMTVGPPMHMTVALASAGRCLLALPKEPSPIKSIT